MGKIKLLDEITINKIAAGEIIERPASIVKELVENSIDAKANNIIIEIKDGGKSYIRVTDDGEGIPRDEVELAFKRHSTSKIESIEDLNNTISLGFRGEALASISTVSKIEALTKTEKDLKGIQLFLENGDILEKNSIGCPKGTTMIVRELFYNTPVRKKFLKSDLAESNCISDLVYRLALGNFQISFKYIKDNKIIIKTPGNNKLLSNIYLLLGKEFTENLNEIYYENDILKIYGYISNNTFYRGSRNHQYIYINNRYIESQHISRIIEEKYKSLIPINKFPVFIIFLEIDPLLLDVNIHPTKQEVKFKEQNLIDEAIEKAIDSEFDRLYNIPEIELPKKKSKEDKYEDINFLDKPKNDVVEKDNVEKSSNNIVKITYEKPANKIKDASEDYNKNIEQDNITNNIDFDRKSKNIIVLSDLKIIGVIFKTYIIVEDSINENVYIVDQHAAHERVLYEKFKREYENENIAVQKLLAPEIIELTNKELNIIKENIDLFYKLGFEIEEFGMNSIALRGVPILFGKPNYKQMLFDIVDNFQHNIKSNYEMRLEKIMKIACSSAVKGGDRISDIEIHSLFEQLEKADNPYTCPHGRPIIIQITKYELEKQFKRIM